MERGLELCLCPPRIGDVHRCLLTPTSPLCPPPWLCRHAEVVSALKPSPRLAGPQQQVVPLMARTGSASSR